MGNATADRVGIIDETFKGLSNPSEIHRLGRPDIVDGRPGDALIEAVRLHAAEGGFARRDTAPEPDGVVVAEANASRISLDEAKRMAAGADAELKNSEHPE
jgi:hypothetical protein